MHEKVGPETDSKEETDRRAEVIEKIEAEENSDPNDVPENEYRVEDPFSPYYEPD